MYDHLADLQDLVKGNESQLGQAINALNAIYDLHTLCEQCCNLARIIGKTKNLLASKESDSPQCQQLQALEDLTKKFTAIVCNQLIKPFLESTRQLLIKIDNAISDEVDLSQLIFTSQNLVESYIIYINIFYHISCNRIIFAQLQQAVQEQQIGNLFEQIDVNWNTFVSILLEPCVRQYNMNTRLLHQSLQTSLLLLPSLTEGHQQLSNIQQQIKNTQHLILIFEPIATDQKTAKQIPSILQKCKEQLEKLTEASNETKKQILRFQLSRIQQELASEKFTALTKNF